MDGAVSRFSPDDLADVFEWSVLMSTNHILLSTSLLKLFEQFMPSIKLPLSSPITYTQQFEIAKVFDINGTTIISHIGLSFYNNQDFQASLGQSGYQETLLALMVLQVTMHLTPTSPINITTRKCHYASRIYMRFLQYKGKQWSKF